MNEILKQKGIAERLSRRGAIKVGGAVLFAAMLSPFLQACETDNRVAGKRILNGTSDSRLGSGQLGQLDLCAPPATDQIIDEHGRKILIIGEREYNDSKGKYELAYLVLPVPPSITVGQTEIVASADGIWRVVGISYTLSGEEKWLKVHGILNGEKRPVITDMFLTLNKHRQVVISNVILEQGEGVTAGCSIK